MQEPRIFRLHLAAPLSSCFRLAAETPQAAQSAPKPEPALASVEEGLFAFEPEALLSENRESGPTLRLPLSLSSSRLSCLPSGDYIFSQWRKADYPSPEKGFEEFIRQAWWEGRKTQGPWFLRVVGEDGGRAYQGLRRLAEN